MLKHIILQSIESYFNNIENDLEQVNDARESFEVFVASNMDFEFLTTITADELLTKLEPDRAQFSKELAITTDQNWLKQIVETLDVFINKANKLQEDVACISMRIADDDKTLKQNVIQSLNDLVKTGAAIDSAYEILNFDKKNRRNITIQEIEERYKPLSDSGELSGKGHQVRQAGFILRNKHSKLLYDHYLDELEEKEDSLSILRISPETAENFGICFMSLGPQLMIIKQQLEEIKKQVAAKITS